MSDSPGHNIAWRKLAGLVIFGHETVQLGIAQHCAFTAQGLREKKVRGILYVQGRRMKLYELHVTDLGAGAMRHGDSVSGGYGGVFGVAVNLASAARGQQHRRAPVAM